MNRKRRVSILMGLLSGLALTSCAAKDKRGAENVDRVFLKNECTEYFFHLERRYPLNVKGTCGYVAIATLLAYYDNLTSLPLVDDQYKAYPNGLIHPELSEVKSLNTKDYYSFMEEHKDKYLQGLLLTDVNQSYGWYNFTKSKEPGMLFNGGSSRAKDYYSEHHAVLDHYLYNMKGFTEEQVKTYRIKEDIRNEMIRRITEGIPILMNCTYHGRDGHVFILYDYDAENDEFYGNLLLIQEEILNHVKLSSYYDKIDAPIIMEISKEYLLQ